jgi:hypothetical protein
MAPIDRLHRDEDGLDHDVLYSVLCVGSSERQFERITRSLDFLPRRE